MSHDPQESVLEEEEYDDNDEDNEVENGEVEYVTNISPSDEWLAFRNNMYKMATATCDHGKGKNKQYWNEDEVKALVDVLKELAGDPLWKVDGGFKNNYMVEVRKRIAQKITNFKLEVNPHIDSKIKYLRNKYNPISEMLMQSGCQWDDVENKINCEKQWYDDWCKTHKNANGLWNFKFPYLHKLDTVWGRDRATGLKAEDIAEACEDNNNHDNTLLISSSDTEDEVFVVPNTQNPPVVPSSSQSKKNKKLSPPTESSYKKKKTLTLEQTIDAKLDGFSSDFKSVCGQMASKIGVAADALAVDANKSESVSEDKMQEVMNILITMGISHFDVGKVVEFCYNDPTKVKTLFLLPSYMRKSYVLGLLHPEN
ncbi:replication factor C subunit 2 [Tanacetum coccineum]|uniref:Replication factor C subunit 2 n=1 Tax=Tanacetum coccineum TaxID=301880 RepID=A0ABQ4XTP1_9ASTR